MFNVHDKFLQRQDIGHTNGVNFEGGFSVMIYSI